MHGVCVYVCVCLWSHASQRPFCGLFFTVLVTNRKKGAWCSQPSVSAVCFYFFFYSFVIKKYVNAEW